MEAGLVREEERVTHQLALLRECFFHFVILLLVEWRGEKHRVLLVVDLISALSMMQI